MLSRRFCAVSLVLAWPTLLWAEEIKTAIYSEADLSAIQEIIVARGLLCDEVDRAAPVAWTNEHVTISVGCGAYSYRVEIWYNGATGVTKDDS